MYAKLHDSFWGDLKRKGITSDGKLLFSYLISCPHHNMVGLYHIPYAYVSADLGWSHETVSERFAELLSSGFVEYDEGAEMVLVKNFLRHNPLDNPNVEKKATSIVAQLPETQLFQSFASILKRHEKRYPDLIETVSERYGNTVTYSVTNSVTVTESECENTRTRENGGGLSRSAFGEFENVWLHEGELSGLYNGEHDKATIDAAIEWYSGYKKANPAKPFPKDADYANIKRYAIPAVLEQRARRPTKAGKPEVSEAQREETARREIEDMKRLLGEGLT